MAEGFYLLYGKIISYDEMIDLVFNKNIFEFDNDDFKMLQNYNVDDFKKIVHRYDNEWIYDLQESDNDITAILTRVFMDRSDYNGLEIHCLVSVHDEDDIFIGIVKSGGCFGGDGILTQEDLTPDKRINEIFEKFDLGEPEFIVDANKCRCCT